MYNQDDYCHEKIKLEFQKGLYDSSIDATYILYLDGNIDRYNKIMNQIKKYQPTKNIFIIKSKSYKKCNKNDNIIINSVFNDIIYTHLEVYAHAENHNLQNILILEDDFIFDEDIANAINIKEINNFLIKKKNQNFMYFFGGCPIIVYPTINLYHYKCLYIYALHGYVISHKFRQKILSLNKQKFVNDLNFETNLGKNSNQYMFYKPLIYQMFPATENKKIWSSAFGFKSKLCLYLIKIFNLDKEYKKPYAIMYYITKNLIILIIIIIIIMIFRFFI